MLLNNRLILMKHFLKIILQLILFIILTVVTQIGGIVYLLGLLISNRRKQKSKGRILIIFTGLYLVSTFLLIPFVAPIFGREKIKNTERIQPANYLTILLNRNYVRPELNKILLQTEKVLKGTNIKIHYLDANFPFIDRFPLLPHLSHNDGKKIDISLIYETENGTISGKQKSTSGYGVFENPKVNEFNQIKTCLEKGYFQYDYPKYITFGIINKDLVFSEKGTKRLINSILKNNSVGKIFIEPHLKKRMNLTNSKIRYHGCRAVRHDDHIHLQLR